MGNWEIDTRHLIPDTWHLTCDTWHMTHGGGWTFSHNFSSPALTVWDRQCLEDSEWKDDTGSVNYLTSMYTLNTFASSSSFYYYLFSFLCPLMYMHELVFIWQALFVLFCTIYIFICIFIHIWSFCVLYVLVMYLCVLISSVVYICMYLYVLLCSGVIFSSSSFFQYSHVIYIIF